MQTIMQAIMQKFFYACKEETVHANNTAEQALLEEAKERLSCACYSTLCGFRDLVHETQKQILLDCFSEGLLFGILAGLETSEKTLQGAAFSMLENSLGDAPGEHYCSLAQKTLQAQSITKQAEIQRMFGTVGKTYAEKLNELIYEHSASNEKAARRQGLRTGLVLGTEAAALI